MKKILFSAASLAVLAGSAFAADLPSRKEPVIAPAPSPMWTGAYAGLNIGYGFGTSNGAYTGAFPLIDTWDDAQKPLLNFRAFDNSQGILFGNTNTARMTQYGVIGGGQLGYNYQWRDRYILGFETDIQGAGIKGSGSGSNMARGEIDYTYRTGQSTDVWSRFVSGGNSLSASLNWLGTARGRLGYLITPTLMAYGTGGLSYGGISASVNPIALVSYYADRPSSFRGYQGAVGFSGNSNQLAVGWNAGGGFEWMFMSNWSAKVEAIYYNLGSLTLNSYTYAPSSPIRSAVTGQWLTQNTTQVSFNGIIARAGVNYHFNLGAAPVVAKF